VRQGRLKGGRTSIKNNVAMTWSDKKN